MAGTSKKPDLPQERDTAAERPTRPLVEIVGEATPEQLAALLAVLSGMGEEAQEPADPPSRWADRAAALRPPLHPGPGGWRASFLPR